jgi:hypothetical protein
MTNEYNEYIDIFPEVTPENELFSFPRSTKGFGKIPRDIVESKVWEENESTNKLYIFLLLFMNYSDTHYQGYTIKPGQMAVGRKALSKQTKMTENKVRGALERLEALGVISINTEPKKFSIVTIIGAHKEDKDPKQLTDIQKKFWFKEGELVCQEGYLTSEGIVKDILKDLEKHKLKPSEDTLIKIINSAIKKGKEESKKGKINKLTGKKDHYGYYFIFNYVLLSIRNYHNKEASKPPAKF